MGRLDDVKEPLMSDREALTYFREWKNVISTQQELLQSVLDVAIQALEDRILAEDDGR